MASSFEQYYDMNPVAVIDQNQWDLRIREVMLRFREEPVVYTPLIEWGNRTQQTGAQTVIETELMEPDINANPIPMTANYIKALGVDSRQRSLSVLRYGDKVQLHKSSNIFQQWQLSGGRDWQPLLRGILGQSVVRKNERLSRDAFLRGPQSYWTYGGNATSIATIGSDDTFGLDVVNQWNLRIGNTGNPLIPDDLMNSKVAVMPPGCVYDFQNSLASASGNENALYRDARIYSGEAIRYEVGAYKDVRFIQHPNDKYGFNNAVLYNAGAITTQYGVTEPIKMGDGAPNPSTTLVDDMWAIGQKAATHWIQLEAFTSGEYVAGDLVSIHISRTSDYGVTNGVDFLDGYTIMRRVYSVDATNNRLVFDRPIMLDYDAAFTGSSESGSTQSTFYAYVTKAQHIGLVLVVGGRGAVRGDIGTPLTFYEPDPVDDFKSIWRFVWDQVVGYNPWEPMLFECHFVALTLPKPGGLITP